MEVAQWLGRSADLRIDHCTITGSALVIEVISPQAACGCPMCGQPSAQMHRRCRRVVAAVPWGNRPVRLH